MNKRTVTWAVAASALACVSAVRAHHSMSMFDVARPIWVTGTVVRYEPINPHAMLSLEAKRGDGEVQRWVVEGPSLGRLKRMGVGTDFLKVGDAVEVCGFPFKEQFSGGVPQPSMHAHVLVMPDGKMRLFGPYGSLVNCVRPNDSTQPWVEFLDRDPLARKAWCDSRDFVRIALIPPKSFVDEISKLMPKPCA
jgi:hypothetical protein